MITANPELDGPAIPLVAEEVVVSRQQNAGDVVRVSTVTHEHEQLVDETLSHQRVEVERVPINRRVDAVPPIREEGDTMIMPVVEEVLVVERQLILREEVRVRRVHMTTRHKEIVVVRAQDAVINRSEGALPVTQGGLETPATRPT